MLIIMFSKYNQTTTSSFSRSLAFHSESGRCDERTDSMLAVFRRMASDLSEQHFFLAVDIN